MLIVSVKEKIVKTLKYGIPSVFANIVGFSIISVGIYFLVGPATVESIDLIAENGRVWLQNNHHEIFNTYRELARPFVGFGLVVLGYSIIKISKTYLRISIEESKKTEDKSGLSEHNF